MSEPIRSDDPKAIELLQEKLSKMETSRDRMKAINKTWKKAEKRAVHDKSGNVGDYFEAFLLSDEVMEVVPVGLGNKMMATIEKAYSWEKQPYASYTLTNLGARIRDAKKRIEKLVASADDETTEYTLNGVRIVDNVEDHRLQLFFEEKPPKHICTRLKQHGFRWTPSIEAWQSYRGYQPNVRAKNIVGDMLLPV